MGQLRVASLAWPAHRGQLDSIKSLLPTHCYQVVAGQLNMVNLWWGQFTAGNWRKRWVEGQAREPVGGQSAEDQQWLIGDSHFHTFPIATTATAWALHW